MSQSRQAPYHHQNHRTPVMPVAAVHGSASTVRAYGLVSLVCVAAAWCLTTSSAALVDQGSSILAWLAVTLAAEFLWLPTVTGRATWSMGSTVHLATIFILGTEAAVWVVAAAAGFSALFIQKRTPVKAVFNLSQMALATGAAGWVYSQLSGALPPEAMRGPAALVPFLSAGVIYLVVNTALVATAVGLWEGLPIVRTWRQDYGYGDALMNSLGLLLLSPLMVLAFEQLGFAGLLLCSVPMVLLRNAASRYIALHEASKALVWNERMAAKGEMAAEIGHELGNVLQVISGQAQLLLMDGSRAGGDRARRSARLIYERAADVLQLSKGLMDFSHREVVRRGESLGDLINETVELVRAQEPYANIEWVIDLDPAETPVEVDGVQIRQVLLNLLRNAGDAVEDCDTRQVNVHTRHTGEKAIIEITDTGHGFPDGGLDRVFEPWFTSKPGGHGFGLGVCYRIIGNHGGTIRAMNSRAGGGMIVIELPAGRGRAHKQAA